MDPVPQAHHSDSYCKGMLLAACRGPSADPVAALLDDPLLTPCSRTQDVDGLRAQCDRRGEVLLCTSSSAPRIRRPASSVRRVEWVRCSAASSCPRRAPTRLVKSHEAPEVADTSIAALPWTPGSHGDESKDARERTTVQRLSPRQPTWKKILSEAGDDCAPCGEMATSRAHRSGVLAVDVTMLRRRACGGRRGRGDESPRVAARATGWARRPHRGLVGVHYAPCCCAAAAHRRVRLPRPWLLHHHVERGRCSVERAAVHHFRHRRGRRRRPRRGIHARTLPPDLHAAASGSREPRMLADLLVVGPPRPQRTRAAAVGGSPRPRRAAPGPSASAPPTRPPTRSPTAAQPHRVTPLRRVPSAVSVSTSGCCRLEAPRPPSSWSCPS